MARQKLSEHRSKQMLAKYLGHEYRGIEVTPTVTFEPTRLDVAVSKWAVKVDQGVKQRAKRGLMQPSVVAAEINDLLATWREVGFDSFLIEPSQPHDSTDESYLALEETIAGVKLTYAAQGGIDIEAGDGVDTFILDEQTTSDVADAVHLPAATIEILFQTFHQSHLSLLEINPYIMRDETFLPLDAAVYVDDAASHLVDGNWSATDFRTYNGGRESTPQERDVIELAASSQASFKLEVLNPDGAISMLLSGGGASVVLADEVYHRGSGAQLANYGEYSGNPNRDETRRYTEAILELLLASHAPRKVLIIGGGVANFTDVRATFHGIRDAMNQHLSRLHASDLKIHIRRGGPFETEALADMKQFLEQHDLLGSVAGSDTVLTTVVERALSSLAETVPA